MRPALAAAPTHNDPSAAGALEQAMSAAFKTNFDEAYILRHARKHDWLKSAQALLTALQQHTNRLTGRYTDPIVDGAITRRIEGS